MGKTKRKVRYTCNVCNGIFFGPKTFKDHLIDSPNCATYRCQFCTFCCQDEITLKQHMSQKSTCSKKRLASLESGFLNQSSKFCDLKKVKSHKMKFPSDAEISEFSSEDQEIIYNQIISQITGSERLSFDINTKTINSVSNTVVESSNVKKKNCLHSVISHQTLGILVPFRTQQRWACHIDLTRVLLTIRIMSSYHQTKHHIPKHCQMI